MINEEFIDAAKVHIKILIYKHIDKMGTTTDPGTALLSVCPPVCPCDSVLGAVFPWQGLLLSHAPEKPPGLESCFSFDFNLLLELSWCKTACEEKNHHVCLESVK